MVRLDVIGDDLANPGGQRSFDECSGAAGRLYYGSVGEVGHHCRNLGNQAVGQLARRVVLLFAGDPAIAQLGRSGNTRD